MADRDSGASDDCARGGDTSSSRSVLATMSLHSYPKVDPTGTEDWHEHRLEPRPQGKVERHSGIEYELVQALDALVLQMADQLVGVFQFFRTLVVVEQVIQVAKILLEDQNTQRSTLCEPQLAEQLVEVPTILYFLKQTVDIPVRGARVRRRGDLQGFHPEQSSTAALGAEQIVDVPVPAASSSFSLSADEPFEGFFFALFSERKKVRGSPGRSVRRWVRAPAHPRCALIKWLLPSGSKPVMTSGCALTRPVVGALTAARTVGWSFWCCTNFNREALAVLMAQTAARIT